MREALLMAEQAEKRREVPIGCVVITQSNDILAKGFNEVNATLNATRHAEMIAIDQLVDYCLKSGNQLNDICSRCVLYVTVEPCVMCTYALRLIGLTKVTFGCCNERFGGCGSVMDIHSISLGSLEKNIKELPQLELTKGILKERAVSLLQGFYEGENPHAPDEKRKRKRDL